MKRCVAEQEATQALESFQFSPYGGHRGKRTAHRVLQYGFILPALFIDVALFGKGWD